MPQLAAPPAPLTRLEIHQRALRAAAAVASLGLACSGTAQSTVSGSAVALDAGAEVATAAGADAVADAGPLKDGGAPTDGAVADAPADTPGEIAADVAADGPVADVPMAVDAVADSADSADSADTDAAAAADALAAKPDCTKARQQPTTPDCCEQLANWCAAAFPGAGKEADDCHWGPNFDGSTGCVPWGPPAPPAMLGDGLGLVPKAASSIRAAPGSYSQALGTTAGSFSVPQTKFVPEPGTNLQFGVLA